MIFSIKTVIRDPPQTNREDEDMAMNAGQIALHSYLIKIYGLLANKEIAATNQGYNMEIRLLWIEKDSIYDLFLENTTLEGLKVARKQSLCSLHTWFLEKYRVSIAILNFGEDAIEAQCEELLSDRGTGLKMESNKGQGKSSI